MVADRSWSRDRAKLPRKVLLHQHHELIDFDDELDEVNERERTRSRASPS
jgi:hypothetical protein